MATKPQMVKVEVWMKSTWVKRLDSMAKKGKISRSALIRAAIDASLKKG